MANLIRGHSNSLIKKILFENNDSDDNDGHVLKNNYYYLHTPRIYGWPKQIKKPDLEIAIDNYKGTSYFKIHIKIC